MPGGDFDIYQTETGYVAVTNAVRRAILSALAKKDRQLPELVKITKKAKPTLSSVHMRELLETKLVEELAHPTDKRKKIYRLKGRRIGSSHLPVDQLRDAVKSYAGAAATRLLLPAALDAIAAAPASASDSALRAQARRLGEHARDAIHAPTPRDAVNALAAFFERENLARPLRLDLESHALELEIDKQLDGDEARLALLIAALCDGMLGQRQDARARLSAQNGRRFTISLGGA